MKSSSRNFVKRVSSSGDEVGENSGTDSKKVLLVPKAGDFEQEGVLNPYLSGILQTQRMLLSSRRG